MIIQKKHKNLMDYLENNPSEKECSQQILWNIDKGRGTISHKEGLIAKAPKHTNTGEF
jgi:hypothetical protein